METLRIYEVLSIRVPGTSTLRDEQPAPRQRHGDTRASDERYFAWLLAAQSGPREREMTKRAHWRLA